MDTDSIDIDVDIPLPGTLISFCSERTCSLYAGHFGVALWPRVASRLLVNKLTD